jgi:hypothetical protein
VIGRVVEPFRQDHSRGAEHSSIIRWS